MPGIYIHIPFCRQACHYCNFHFSVSQKRRPEFVKALIREIKMQKDFLYPDSSNRIPLDTLYLGGGTPSLLDTAELDVIFNVIHKYYSFAPNAEITLEANPDDLIPGKLETLRKLSVNRLSIGIQSFYEDDLQFMNRSHNSRQAIDVLNYAQEAGFVNITADLIYGTPGMTDKQWEQNIMQLVKMGIPHISAYSLTVEKKTALDVFIRKGKVAPVDEEQAARQFDLLCALTAQHGYEHYEISNFGKKGYFSKHNLGYWSGEPYLGMGPSAHSFKPGMRQWNVAHTGKYIDSLKLGKIPAQQEILTEEQQYNEYVMTALRTMWGIDEKHVKNKFGARYHESMMRSAQKYLKNGKLVHSSGRLKVTPSGKFFADGIASDLFA